MYLRCMKKGFQGNLHHLIKILCLDLCFGMTTKFNGFDHLAFIYENEGLSKFSECASYIVSVDCTPRISNKLISILPKSHKFEVKLEANLLNDLRNLNKSIIIDIHIYHIYKRTLHNAH